MLRDKEKRCAEIIPDRDRPRGSHSYPSPAIAIEDDIMQKLNFTSRSPPVLSRSTATAAASGECGSGASPVLLMLWIEARSAP